MADVELSTLGSVIKTAYEGETNTNAYTDAEKSKLAGVEASADVTDTANVTAAGALMDSEVTNLAAVKAFDPTDYATAAQGSTADSAVQPGDDAAGLGSGAATDGYVLTADGAGGAAWEAAAGGVDWTATQANNLSAATGDQVAFDFSSTVNKATSGNYTGIKLNVTETAAPGSDDRLLDLKVGGTSKFYVDNGGILNIAASGTFAEIRHAADSDVAIKMNNSFEGGQLRFSNNSGVEVFGLFGSGIRYGAQVRSDAAINWASGNVGGASDVFLFRDAAANLALRNSTNAQTFRIYNTYTDASNYERLAITGSAITVETAGTGTDDIDLTLTPAGAGNVRFGTHSAIGAETVTGFITIKDAGGTSRKLAVVS